MARLILLNKPYGYLSQFTDTDGHPGLKQLCPIQGVYPAGRLDHDSEGLLLLTDDGQLQARISHPDFKLPKTYLVQVEGTPKPEQLNQLRNGLMLKDGMTAPASARLIEPPNLWDREPPIRHRANIPTHWLRLTIREGRNRQVRRMTAAVGLPTLRLVRESIGQWRLDDLQPGEYREEKVHLPAAMPANKHQGQTQKKQRSRAKPGKRRV